MYRDIFQKALYGQSRDQLSILCEDAVAEGVIRGVLDVLNIELGLRHEDVVIGRNTGRDEFPGHVRALGKFGKLRDFIVVLDGDSRDLEGTIRAIAEEYGHSVQPLFLPGRDPPERWLWRKLRENPDEYAGRLGVGAPDMESAMTELARVAEGAVKQGDNLRPQPRRRPAVARCGREACATRGRRGRRGPGRAAARSGRVRDLHPSRAR